MTVETTDTPESTEVETSLLDPQTPAEGDQPEGEAPKGDEPPVDGDGDQPEGEAPKDDDGDEEPEGAPDEYAEFEVPEGVALNEDALGSFKEIAKELNLTQDSAQKFVGIATDLVQQQAEAFQRQITETTQGWKDAVEGDTELGAGPNKGLKADAQQAVAAARDMFASPELVEMLNETKFGNHPEMVRLFVRIGKAIGEDKLVQAGKPTTPKPFYDHPTSVAASGR